ncbi:thioredoxin-like protein 1 [Trichonephila clavipes]|nr:thioredoxin-like protein 1 [Trichonephila clavipes]
MLTSVLKQRTSQGVSSMPTFIFYKNKMKIGQVSGADATALEAKIKEFIGGEGDEASDSGVQGHLIMSYGFNQAVNYTLLKISAPEDNGPKTLKLFINQPRTLDFVQADSSEPVQRLGPGQHQEASGLVANVSLEFISNMCAQSIKIRKAYAHNSHAVLFQHQESSSPDELTYIILHLKEKAPMAAVSVTTRSFRYHLHAFQSLSCHSNDMQFSTPSDVDFSPYLV